MERKGSISHLICGSNASKCRSKSCTTIPVGNLSGVAPSWALQLREDIPKHVGRQISMGLALFEDFQTPLAGNNNEGLSFRKSKTKYDNKGGAIQSHGRAASLLYSDASQASPEFFKNRTNTRRDDCLKYSADPSPFFFSPNARVLFLVLYEN